MTSNLLMVFSAMMVLFGAFVAILPCRASDEDQKTYMEIVLYGLSVLLLVLAVVIK